MSSQIFDEEEDESNKLKIVESELEQVKKQLEEIEGKIEAWEDDPDGEFQKLKPGKKLAYENPKGYYDYLQKQHDKLSAKESSLNVRTGGQLQVYAKVKKGKIKIHI